MREIGENSCRICLDVGAENLADLDKVLIDQRLALDVINAFSSFKLDFSKLAAEGLPRKICEKCTAELKASVQFWYKAWDSHMEIEEQREECARSELMNIFESLSDSSDEESCSEVMINNTVSKPALKKEFDDDEPEAMDFASISPAETDVDQRNQSLISSDTGVSKSPKIRRSTHLKIIRELKKPAQMKAYPRIVLTKAGKTNVGQEKREAFSSEIRYCGQCDKVFNNRISIYQHVKYVHRGGSFQFNGKEFKVQPPSEIFECNVCSKTYKRKGDLVRHLKSHGNVRDHVCKYCKKAFVTKDYLTRHIYTHTKNYPEKCAICGKGFPYPSSLKVHMKTHTK